MKFQLRPHVFVRHAMDEGVLRDGVSRSQDFKKES